MATTLEELVVTLEAQNKEFMQAMVKAQNQTQKSMDAMQKSVEDMSKKGNESLGFFQTAMATMAGFVGGAVVTEAFAIAKDAANALFQSLIVDGVKASSEAIDSMNRLNFALAQQGDYSAEASTRMAEWAGELQKTTKYEDDLLISNAALLGSMTTLSEQGIRDATEAAMNLSAAFGIDLETATRMVGKAANGETDAFKKIGINIQETGDKASTFANTLRELGKLGDAATNQAQSASGAYAMMTNAYGEVQEAVGGLITKNVVVVDTMNAVSQVFFGASESIDDNQQSLRELVGKGIVIAIQSMVGLITVLDALGRIADSVFNGLQATAYAALYPVVKAMNLVGMASDEMVETMKIGFQESARGMKEAFTEDTTLGAIATKFAEVGLAAEGGLEKVRAGAVAIVEPLNNTATKTNELSYSMKMLVEEGEKLSKSYMEAALNGKAAIDQQLTDAAALREAKLAAAAEEQDNHALSLTALYDRKQQELEIEAEFNEAKLEALTAQQEAETEAVNAAYEQGKINRESYEAALSGIAKKYDGERRKQETDYSNFKRTMDQQEVENRKSQIGQLASLQSSQNEYAKGVGKAFAVANTIIKTQEGAQAAYSAMAGIPFVGPALGAAAAAAVIADGASRISQIRGAQTGITEVPGIGSRDSFGPVALAPGERVVPGETNQDLKAMIAMVLEQGGVGGGGQVHVTIELKGEAGQLFEAQVLERRALGVSQI